MDDNQLRASIRGVADLYSPTLTADAIVARHIRQRQRRAAVIGSAVAVVLISVSAVLVSLHAGSRGPKDSAVAVASKGETSASHGDNTLAPSGTLSSPDDVSPTSSASPRHSTPTAAKPVTASSCSLQQMRVSLEYLGPTMPGVEANIKFKNLGRRSCKVQGWPVIRVASIDGRSASDRVVNVVATGAWGYESRVVTVAPGATANVALLIGNPVTNDCRPEVIRLRVGLRRGATVELVGRGARYTLCQSGSTVAVSAFH